MSTISAPYAPGTPCWIDLMAKDQQAALDFYKDVFGWGGEPGPAEFGGYAVMDLGGRPVCGIGPAMAPEGAPEPPHVWTTYLASDDADATAAKVKAAHGTLIAEPMDVGSLGRMMIAVDPTGAVFGVWQHKEFFGAVAVNEPGSLVWNECNTRDVPAAAAFYQAALGIKAVPMKEMAGYFGLEVDGKVVGGMQDMGANFPAEVPPHWMAWFAVDDTDATVDAAVKRGANVVVPPTDVPPGRMAGIQDPWGAVFCVLKQPDPTS
ncbi:VOC family protein [Streptacidiphilus sp. MAP5-3]|uniref:VOC family protein n=1 Tax=unclassified Streptacidiphilus TaxID=2643834 RepID=UPI0035148006